MLFYAYFNTNRTCNGDSVVPFLVSYDFWRFLVAKAAEQATDFMIRCWPDEQSAFAIGERFGKRIANEQTQEIVFTGKVVEPFIQELLRHPIDGNALPWFTLVLSRGEQRLLSSEHYGSELIRFGLREDEQEGIRDLIKNYREIRDVDFYPEESCEC